MLTTCWIQHVEPDMLTTCCVIISTWENKPVDDMLLTTCFPHVGDMLSSTCRKHVKIVLISTCENTHVDDMLLTTCFPHVGDMLSSTCQKHVKIVLISTYENRHANMASSRMLATGWIQHVVVNKFVFTYYIQRYFNVFATGLSHHGETSTWINQLCWRHVGFNWLILAYSRHN